MIRKLNERLKAWQNALTRKHGSDISTPSARRKARWHFLLSDHAFLRFWWTNLDEIAPGIWRSNQPSPARLARQAAKGLRTVINLRGQAQESFWLFEREACDSLGITLHDLRMSARNAPSPERLQNLHTLLSTAARPLLFHCKSGADRTGLAAALYLLAFEKRPLEEAQKQLSFRYLHLTRGPAGILDHILRVYGRASKGREIGFMDWIGTEYDPADVTASWKRWKAGGKEGAW